MKIKNFSKDVEQFLSLQALRENDFEDLQALTNGMSKTFEDLQLKYKELMKELGETSRELREGKFPARLMQQKNPKHKS